MRTMSGFRFIPCDGSATCGRNLVGKEEASNCSARSTAATICSSVTMFQDGEMMRTGARASAGRSNLAREALDVGR